MSQLASGLIRSSVIVLILGCVGAAGLVAQARPRPVVTDTAAAAGLISGRMVDELPVDSVRGALLLQPGVGTDATGGLSLRGTNTGESATYIDGIPVTPGDRIVLLSPATNSVEEAAALPGPLSAALGNANAGAILLRTRSSRGARLSYETDRPFGAASLGLNRFEGSVGFGLGRHLSIFAGGALNGQSSAEPGFGARSAPIFVPAGLDTTVTADGQQVDVSTYAVSRGSCDLFVASSNAGIAGNYDLPCHGDRTPLSALSNHQLLVKAQYSAGRSTIGILGLRSRHQGRAFDYLTSFVPADAFGQSATSGLVGVTLAHQMRGNGVLRASLSRQTDERLGGPLSTSGEASSRDPSMGIMFGRLGFKYDFESFPINAELIENYRQNTPGSRRSPYDLENTAQYSTVSEFRSNPYAVTGFVERGGPVGLLELHRENRTVATAGGDWQVSPNSRFVLGGELTRYEVTQYQHQLTSQAFSDVYHVAPRAFNLFAEDVFQYGHVTFSAGIRYDRFASNADRPFSLDTVSSSPTFGTYLPFPRISSYAGTFQGDSLVVTMRDQAHSAFQPRFRMQYAPSPRTEIRIGYSKQAEIPDFSALYAGINTDLAITNFAQAFGTDLDLARSWIGELGGRQQLGRLGSLDGAVWTRRGAAGILARLVRQPDPTRHGAGLDIRQFAVDDSASASGAEIRLERTSGALTGSIGYAYLHAEVANGFRSPNDRPHTVTAAAALRVRNTAAFAGFRYASGVPFDSCQSLGNEGATSDVGCGSGFPLIGFRTSRLPALRQLDLRLTQALRLGGRSVTAFLDARNALDSRNVLRVYSVTGTTSSPLEAQSAFSRDSSSFANEARANSLYRPDGAVDLTFAGGGTGGCAAWRTQTGSGGAPNCVALIRAEQRFGNGDGVFDLTEQRSASSAAYAAFHGAQLFTAAPRRVRVGLQIGL